MNAVNCDSAILSNIYNLLNQEMIGLKVQKSLVTIVSYGKRTFPGHFISPGFSGTEL